MVKAVPAQPVPSPGRTSRQLLSQYRTGSRTAGALRTGRRRLAGCDRHGTGRWIVYNHGRGTRRFGVTIRYPRGTRSDPQQIARGAVPAMDGAVLMIPLGQLARLSSPKGPSIRTENALLSAYIYVDIRDRDIVATWPTPEGCVAEQVKFPPATTSGAASSGIWNGLSGK